MNKEAYAQLVSAGLRQRLFEIDKLLAGRECPFRLRRDDYERARDAISELYRVIKNPDLEPTPLALRRHTAARSDADFQRFLGKLAP